MSRLGRLLPNCQLNNTLYSKVAFPVASITKNLTRMAKKKGGFYAVQNGRSTGVFTDWNQCSSQVKGYQGAVYKKFDTYQEAQAFSESSSGYGASHSSSGSESGNRVRGTGGYRGTGG